MSRPLRTAAVGVGHLGRHHARIYAEMEGVELVGVVDADAARAREVGERHGVPHLTDHRRLPEALDAVSVATPTASHFEVARHFLARGISVLVEKPLTTTVAEGRELVELARRGGAVLQVGHVERFNPACLAVERLGIRPRFVESTRISPFSFRSSDIGVVLDMMIHDLDLVLHLVGTEVEKVDAVGVPVLGRREDIANARITFQDGCVANITASRVAMKTERKIRIFAPDCYASIDFGERKGRLYRLGPDSERMRGEVDRIDPRSVPNPLAFVFGNLIQVEEIAMGDQEPLRAELEAFVHAVRTGERPIVSGEDGLAALVLADRILEKIGTFQERSRPFIEG